MASGSVVWGELGVIRDCAEERGMKDGKRKQSGRETGRKRGRDSKCLIQKKEINIEEEDESSVPGLDWIILGAVNYEAVFAVSDQHETCVSLSV